MKFLVPAFLLGQLASASPISTTAEATEEVNEKFNYDGYRVLRVAYSDYEKNPDAVAALGEQLSDEPAQFGHVDLLVAPDKDADVENLLVSHQVIQDDIGAAIRQEEEETVEYRGEFCQIFHASTVLPKRVAKQRPCLFRGFIGFNVLTHGGTKLAPFRLIPGSTPTIRTPITWHS